MLLINRGRMKYFLLIIIALNLPIMPQVQNPEWIVFTPQNSPLKTGFIMDISVDKLNNKWIATDSGLVKTDGNSWTTYSTMNGNSPGARFFVVQTDKNGIVWCQSHSMNGVSIGLLKFDGAQWTNYNTNNSPLPSDNIKSIVIDSANNKWILSSMPNGNCYLTKFDGDSLWKNYTGYFYHGVYGDLAVVDSANSLWMAKGNQLTNFDGINYYHYSGFFGAYPTDVKIDHNHAIWIAGGWAGWGSLYKWKDGMTTVFGNVSALSITIDNQNNIWVGSVGTLHKYNGTTWTIFNSTNSPLTNDVMIWSLSFDLVGNLWMVLTSGPTLTTGGIAVYKPGGVIIPVELLNVNVQNFFNSNIVSWSTATETNNKGFEIQRSQSGYAWERIGFVAGHGTTTEIKNYSYEDKNLSAGKYSYRLKQIDFDGSFDYSKVVEVEVGAPTKNELSQNYPNPFNPTTRIQYQVSSGANVSLKVFDILGNEVTTLVNEYKPAGNYEVEFQSSVGSLQLASGIYFYQLKAGNYVEMKKMMLLR